jgi:hypothetical protein
MCMCIMQGAECRMQIRDEEWEGWGCKWGASTMTKNQDATGGVWMIREVC